eukprot:3104529-Prymnesium_polylepis.2
MRRAAPRRCVLRAASFAPLARPAATLFAALSLSLSLSFSHPHTHTRAATLFAARPLSCARRRSVRCSRSLSHTLSLHTRRCPSRAAGAAPRHAPLPHAPRGRLLDGRVRQPRHGRLGLPPVLLAVPQPEGGHGLPADPLHHVDARRPRPPGARAQDGEEDGGDGHAGRLLLREHVRPARARTHGLPVGAS